MPAPPPPGGFLKRRVPPARVGEQPGLFGSPESQALGVSELVARMNGALRGALPDVWVKGEVAEWKVWSSGHAYFSLKDERACVAAMMWSADLERVPFRPDSGLLVLARGRPDVYAPKGKLSFVVSELVPAGAGALQLAFEQLKARLAAEGLFEVARKRPLPLLPRCIGVVTSRHGAAVRDVLKVLGRRFPNARVTIYPVAVQGAAAPAEIARALGAFSRVTLADVVILARGGGSKEDLSAFNDERVVRAVAASRVPVISAVGHEIDVTLADLAADLRAATPSHAAELVVGRREELEETLSRRTHAMRDALRARLGDARAELMALAGARGLGELPERVRGAAREASSAREALFGAVRRLPDRFEGRLAALGGRVLAWPERAALPRRKVELEREGRRVAAEMQVALASAEQRLAGVVGRLDALNPLRVLARGYAVAYRQGENVPLRDAALVSHGDAVRVVLAKGELAARVTRVLGREEKG